MRNVTAVLFAFSVGLFIMITEGAAQFNGCWVKVFESGNFRGDRDLIPGGRRYRNMRNLPNSRKGDWGDEIGSLIMGPRATGTFYEDENFSDNRMSALRGQRWNRLGNFDDQIDSMIINCH